MDQQEEKNLKNYYAKCVLRNKFGLSNDLAEILSDFMLNFYDKFFKDFDPEKAKHYRNAASNMAMNPRPTYTTKIEFYIGLMDKDTRTYRYSKEQAKEKVFDILGDCTIAEAKGCYTNENGEKIIMDTLVATKLLEKIPEDFQHNVSYKLKEIFNQESILNVSGTYEVRYNRESEQEIKYIQSTMKLYGLGWEAAQMAMDAGW